MADGIVYRRAVSSSVDLLKYISDVFSCKSNGSHQLVDILVAVLYFFPHKLAQVEHGKIAPSRGFNREPCHHVIPTKTENGVMTPDK